MKTFNVSRDSNFLGKVRADSGEAAIRALFNQVLGGFPDSGEVLSFNQANLDHYIVTGVGESPDPYKDYRVQEVEQEES